MKVTCRQACKRTIQYSSGVVSLLIIGFVIVAAIHMAWTDSSARTHVAAGVLNGTGVAIGTLVGGAIVLRFKTARKFVRRIFIEREDD